MKPFPSSDQDERDQEIIDLLKDLGSFQSTYPSELLAARRAAFLEQVGRLRATEPGEELTAEEQELVKLLETFRSVQAEYPKDLLAGTRSAFLRQIERTESVSVWDKLRVSLPGIFQSKTASGGLPRTGVLRLSLVIAVLLAAVMIGSLLFPSGEEPLGPAPSQASTEPASVVPTSTGEVAITICTPDEQTPSCPSGESDMSQDLADAGNGSARPAVSKDARSGPYGAHQAAYVNDGRGGASWVSDSPHSWIKIDLGTVTSVNTVSLQKGSAGPPSEDDPGQFEISVALSDLYADGDHSDDYVEYAQVFHSEQTGFSGTVLPLEVIRIQFPAIRARFVKITFEKAGAAIEKVGVFMVRPPEFAGQTTTPQVETPGITLTRTGTNTPSLMDTATSVPTSTRLPTDTATPFSTNTSPPVASNTPTLRPTNTLPPTKTATPVPTDPLPSNTPVPSSTSAPSATTPPTEIPPTTPPTSVPPTALPATAQPSPSPESTDPIIVTGHDQTLTFTCNGNSAEVHGNQNTVTLLGSCSSITVTGNRNHVYWQYGSPVITDRGKDNIIEQL
jgi:hypothetical protein